MSRGLLGSLNSWKQDWKPATDQGQGKMNRQVTGNAKERPS